MDHLPSVCAEIAPLLSLPHLPCFVVGPPPRLLSPILGANIAQLSSL